VEPEQVKKLLATGKTDLLDKFVSMRTRRAFKAFLTWDAKEGKVVFEFEPRASKFPPRKTASAAATGTAAAAKTTAVKVPAAKKVARKTAAAKK
jgi:DNA topoisomerase-3